MARTNLKTFKEKAFKIAGVREAYDDLAPAYKLRWQLVELRLRAGLTQEQVADKLKTKKSNISRLESVSSSISPKLSTIADYADAVGYDIKIDFVPKGKGQQGQRLRRTAQKERRR